MTLLPEIQLITLFGTKTLVMHGDSLCIDDVAYQKYRRYTFNKALKALLQSYQKNFGTPFMQNKKMLLITKKPIKMQPSWMLHLEKLKEFRAIPSKAYHPWTHTSA